MAEQTVDDAPGGVLDAEGLTIGVTVRYFAAARAAAGIQEERLVLPISAAAQGFSAAAEAIDRGRPLGENTVGQVLAAAANRHGPGLTRVLERCSFLLDQVAVHGRQTPVRDGQVLDILPPFAGG